MIKVFYGEDRVRAQAEIRRFLGSEYEIVEGADLVATDLPSLMLGGSLLVDERAILIRDLGVNKAVFEKIPEYLETPHKVALFESKIDKRSSTYKELKDKIEFREFVPPKDVNAGLVFDIYKTAKRDGVKAVEMVRKIENEQDPMMFAGLLASQALKDYQARPGVKEKRALLELSKLDMQLKADSKLQPWTLICSFLLQVSSW
ncbi:hypothetical protein IKF20_01165 [Candidatus Saccharibacteria bacterium]|nr:hypothetical protein [Candidatus Saccharibacteria bacterium]MBR3157029.1 hypothetical protein [Candidatus Saccharibacteria bacterium]